MLTQKELKLIFHYDENTGIFFRFKHRKLNSVCKNGYLQTSINGKKYYLHRLAWLYVYGNFPDKEIDHINNNKTDNRICNLRQVTRSQNLSNTKLNKNNKAKHKNVSLHSKTNLWRVVMTKNKKCIVNKYFKELNDAICFANKMREQHFGIYANHG
jgi:hypothetical protein